MTKEVVLSPVIQSHSENMPMVLFQCSLNFGDKLHFLNISEVAKEVFGLSARTIKANGQILLNVITEDGKDDFITSYLDAFHYSRPWNWEGRILVSGIEKWIKVTAEYQ